MLDIFKTRSTKTERLDRGEFTSVEYSRWQKEMWFIHRIFGEVRALRSTLLDDVRSIGQRSVSVLDIAAGSGELLNYIRKQAGEKDVFAVAAESSTAALRMISSLEIPSVRCDANALPFAPNSFDFVFCTLFLHHMNQKQAVNVIAQMASIARKKFYVIDLDRRPLAYFAYRLVGSLFLQRFTRDDGALSILRAHRPNELEQIAMSVGLKNFEIKRSAINRLILTGSI